MKRIISVMLMVCMLLVFMPTTQAQDALYERMNAAFVRLNAAEVLPGWQIDYARAGKNSITLTCPTRNVAFRDVCLQMYALRSRVVTADTNDAMSFVIHYYYSPSVTEEKLTLFQDGIRLFLSQESGLADALYGTSEILSGSSVSARKLTIYLNVNGGFTVDALDEAYYARLKQLVAEARAHSPYQMEQLDYFVRWLDANTTYELGAPGNSADLVVNGKGVCEHYANAVHDFCYMIGMPSLVAKNFVEVHAWNYLYVNNKWLEYDATNYRPLGVNESTLLQPTFGTHSGDSFTLNNLTYVKQETLASRIDVVLDGKTLGFDQKPFVKDGRTLVPLRVIFEALGAQVQWFGDTQTVVASKDGTRVQMTVGDNVYYVNGEAKTLDVAPQVYNGRTLVPARAVAESFDCEVTWFEQINSVLINTR